MAERCGVYGVYAFNSKGGRMTNIEAYYNNDSGFYVGQTRRSAAEEAHPGPQRGRLGNVWASPAPTCATSRSRGAGGTTTARDRAQHLDSEKYPPPEDNVIAGNDIFWNNFNFTRRPFEIPDRRRPISRIRSASASCCSAARTVVENNRLEGNYLGGFAAIRRAAESGRRGPGAAARRRCCATTPCARNEFGLGGNDLNNRDMVYDGSGARELLRGQHR